MNNKNAAEIEEKLLSILSGDFKASDVLSMVVDAVDSVGEQTADGWLALIQDVLTQKADVAGMMKLMLIRGRIGIISRTQIENALVHASRDRLWQAKVKSCEFAGKVELPECFRRLSVLNLLKEGVFCCEKTWGYGRVARLDEFYSKVTVDFTRKKQHQMTFGYAGEALKVLDENHIYVLQSRSPEKVSEITRTAPGDIVKMLLRSIGPQNVDDIKDRLVEMGIITEADWKPFWDGARKALKKDPLVEIPSRRTENVTILEKARGYDSDWLRKLKLERDLTKLLVMLEGLSDADAEDLPPGAVEAVLERYEFVAKAADGSQWDVMGRLLVAGSALSRVTGSDCVADRLDRFFEVLPLKQALKGLNVKLGTSLLDLLMQKDADGCAAVLLGIVEEMPVNIVGDVAQRFKQCGKEKDFLSKASSDIASRTIGPVLFSWICRTPGTFDQLEGIGKYELVNGIIDMLEGSYNGEQLKGQNAIRDCFEDKDWLAVLFSGMPAAQMETAVKRIMESRGWESTGRRSVLAKLLKMNPNLERVLAVPAPKEEGKPRITSWRSFRERSLSLKKIVEVDIPENSKEIGVARSYGDLRENHEYKAAKEHQQILMRRQEELERDLKTVQGTDFAGLPSDKAGPGTIVAISRPNGATQEFCILGEWDRDEELNIISSETKLAQCLLGTVAGDNVQVPGEKGEETCTVISIRPLSDAVRAWING